MTRFYYSNMILRTPHSMQNLAVLIIKREPHSWQNLDIPTDAAIVAEPAPGPIWVPPPPSLVLLLVLPCECSSIFCALSVAVVIGGSEDSEPLELSNVSCCSSC